MPRGLTFGPTNGPEDFQELVFIVFARELYKTWFLFVDDLSVATGRKPCHPPGPSNAHDVVVKIRESTEGERGSVGLGMTAGSSNPSPFAHLVMLLMIAWLKCLVLEVDTLLVQTCEQSVCRLATMDSNLSGDLGPTENAEYSERVLEEEPGSDDVDEQDVGDAGEDDGFSACSQFCRRLK